MKNDWYIVCKTIYKDYLNSEQDITNVTLIRK